MKTLVENSTNLSKYICEDNHLAESRPDRTLWCDIEIVDLTSDNSTIYSVDSVPDDWAGCKYFYDPDAETPWSLVPDDFNPDAPADDYVLPHLRTE